MKLSKILAKLTKEEQAKIIKIISAKEFLTSLKDFKKGDKVSNKKNKSGVVVEDGKPVKVKFDDSSSEMEIFTNILSDDDVKKGKWFKIIGQNVKEESLDKNIEESLNYLDNLYASIIKNKDIFKKLKGKTPKGEKTKKAYLGALEKLGNNLFLFSGNAATLERTFKPE